MAVKKYGYHIVHIGHTVHMLYGHIDLIFAQPTTIYTLHHIGIYALEINMDTKLYIYMQVFTMHIWEMYVIKRSHRHQCDHECYTQLTIMTSLTSPTIMTIPFN